MKRIIISDDDKNIIRQMHESFKENGRVVSEQENLGGKKCYDPSYEKKPNMGGTELHPNRTYKVKPGDTLSQLVQKLGANSEDNIKMMNKFCTKNNEFQLRAGDTIIYSTMPSH